MLNDIAKGENPHRIAHLKTMIMRDIPTVYAAGAIEDTDDNGVGPRKDLKEAVKDLRIIIDSPCDFDYNQKDFPTMRSYMAAHDLEDTYAYTQSIINGDIKAVRKCDFVLVYLDDKAGPGTASECTLARALGKPVVGVFAPGCDRKTIHPWIFGCPNIFFDSFEDFATFVRELQR